MISQSEVENLHDNSRRDGRLRSRGHQQSHVCQELVYEGMLLVRSKAHGPSYLRPRTEIAGGDMQVRTEVGGRSCLRKRAEHLLISALL